MIVKHLFIESKLFMADFLINIHTHTELIERAKRAHSLVMTFEIFGICMYIYIVRTCTIRTAHVLPAQQYLKRS